MIQSDHSHSGPDSMGVWGGAPEEYMRYVANRTVEAIVAAYSSMRPARLYYGTAPGRDLLANQFDYDEANEVVDSDVRVLQAREGSRTIATLLNFSAHATVLGSSNTKASGDWVQAANPLLEKRFGGRAATVVGTLGRTQPADRGCPDPSAVGDDAQNLCKIRAYAARVVDRAAQAAANARVVGGSPVVAARSYLIQDVSSNPLLLGLVYGGSAVGVPLSRAQTPPWLTANVLGTVTATARIGDVLLSAGPGEMYPQIPLKVAELVPAAGHMTAGLPKRPARLPDRTLRGVSGAGQAQLLQPARRRSLADRQRQLLLQRLAHDGRAGDVLAAAGRGRCARSRLEYWRRYDRCPSFANDVVLRHGADTRAPSG